MEMRIILCTSVLLVLAGFSVWAYKAMIGVRPKVCRPRLDAGAGEAIKDLEVRLKRHVSVLAHEIGPRSVFLPHNLKAASDYVRAFWENMEYEVRIQTYRVKDIGCHNLAVEIPGRVRPDEILLIGAHYDTVSHSPGANDNGSAVAALLELSRLFRSKAPRRTIRFVAFANEEPPFFKTSQMGSLVYAKGCRERQENITAMVCLETIGYYRQEPETQKYPFPLGFFYPHRGNFIAVVGNLRSRSLVTSFTRYFMEGSDFPIECAAVFGFITGVDWSDHWSFWHYHYPAIMVTDTALFRYPYYHSHEDTVEKLDYYSLARVSHGIYKALQGIVETAGDL
ncbi:MAG: M28 family peptidase [Thermodesulfobacteriota bacterium]|nr:M28 family peptidase [Thermodesulfobacteriota bacterium]